MRSDRSYRDWRDDVEKQLLRTYCITIADAGFDEEILASRWQSNEDPLGFVEWFGSKYDLIPYEALSKAS